MNSNKSKSTLQDFEVLGKLGQGSFGIVYKVRRKDDKNIYVLKQIDTAKMSREQRKDSLNEIKMLAALNNPYVVKYFDSFIDKNKINIIMEYCENGDLGLYLKRQMGRNLNENKIWKFFIQICLGIQSIHNKKILHRDIKSINVFLTKDDSVRIGDLGVAKMLTQTNNFAHTMVGTPYYLSPELCEEKPYNHKSDVWSLGCVLYEMCTLKHPFDSNNQGALILKIIRGKFDPIPKIYSKDLEEIVNLCLLKDYKARPSIRDILSKPSGLGVIAKAKLVSVSLTIEESVPAPLPDRRPSAPVTVPERRPSEPVIKEISPPRSAGSGAPPKKNSPHEVAQKRLEPPIRQPIQNKQPRSPREERKIPGQFVKHEVEKKDVNIQKPRPKTPGMPAVVPRKSPYIQGAKSPKRSEQQINKPHSKNQNPMAQQLNHINQPVRVRKGAPTDMARQAQQAAIRKPSKIQKPEAARGPPSSKALNQNKPSHIQHASPVVPVTKDEIDEVRNLPDIVKEAKKQPSSVDLSSHVKPIANGISKYAEIIPKNMEEINKNKIIAVQSEKPQNEVDKFFQEILSEEEYKKILNEEPTNLVSNSIHLSDFLVSQESDEKSNHQANLHEIEYPHQVMPIWNVNTELRENVPVFMNSEDDSTQKLEVKTEVLKDKKQLQEPENEALNNSDYLAYEDHSFNSEYDDDENNKEEQEEDEEGDEEQEEGDEGYDDEGNNNVPFEEDDNQEEYEYDIGDGSDEEETKGDSDAETFEESNDPPKYTGFEECGIIEEDEEEAKESLSKLHETHLESDLNKLKRRVRELNRLFSQRVKECNSILGPENFNQVYAMVKQRSEMTQEISSEDIVEIQSTIGKLIDTNAGYSVDEILFGIYKLLYLEPELEGCQKRIQELNDQLNSIKNP